MRTTDRLFRSLLMIGGEARARPRFDPDVSGFTPSPAEVGGRYQEHMWLAGGEPTTRADFLAVLKACGAPISLRTDGLALTEPKFVKMLMAHGVRRICVPIFSIRPDAHDWLSGLQGSARRALKAIRVCADAGLQVHVELTPSRPSAGLLMETVGVLGRLGVHSLWIRRPRLDWMSAEDVVALSPRLGLLEPELKMAGAAASRLGLRVQWVGFSTCAIADLEGARWETDRWMDVDGEVHHEASLGPECGCEPPCEGLPMDYIQRFGWTEFQRFPETRLHSVVRRVVGKTGVFPRGDGTPLERVRIAFGAPSPQWDERFNDFVEIEPSRVIRQRMVEAAQLGARELVLCNSGLLDHPESLDLLWETTRLSFERVSLAGELSALAQCSERILRRLRGIHRADAVWFDPDPSRHDEAVGKEGAFAALLPALNALEAYAGVQTGVYAVLETPEQLPLFLTRFAEWSRPPFFRVSSTKIDVVAMSQALSRVEDLSVQAQVGGLLPVEVWTGPRQTPVRAEPAWGAGVPYWISKIDRGQPRNT